MIANANNTGTMNTAVVAVTKATILLLLLTLDTISAFSTKSLSSSSSSSLSSSLSVILSPSNSRLPIQFNSRHNNKSNKKHQILFAQQTDEDASTNTSTSSTSSSSSSGGQSQAFLDEASDALTSVGWSAPMIGDELTSDDPFVRRINEQIQNESGVDLDQLLNPAKVVNLERDLVNLRSELAVLTGKAGAGAGDLDIINLTTEECDGGGGGEDTEKIRAKIQKKEKDLLIERRSVFRGWLKNIFLGQAVLSLGLSWIMATDPSILFGGFDWYSNIRSIDVSIQVLGFWWWWLFIVPSLRSRRPQGFEKKALDIAFIGTPAVSLIAPIATKDTAIIWIANFVLVAAAYGFAYATYDENDDGNNGDDSKQPEWLKFVMKSLDFGVGKERGARN